MKVALVHDYLKEYGGAERVLEALCEAFPDAPIYTAFYQYESRAYKKFEHRKIFVSWAHFIPFFSTHLHSPLRFLAPLIWNAFDFSKYDVVISSASWYVTKGFGSGSNEEKDSGQATFMQTERSQARMTKKRPIEICYCHTPPRWLYGYKTSIEFQKYLPIKIYASIVGHFMRMYDFSAAQRVDYFLANSEEVAARIKKFYRRESTVIYPPVSLPTEILKHPPAGGQNDKKKGDYYLVVGRIVGSKGLDLAIEAAQKMNFKLKIVGIPAGYYSAFDDLTKKAQKNVEFLGYVPDEELVELYSQAKGFLALAQDEDFGITPVEAMLCGTGVVAYDGGGYKETVMDGKTGVFFHEYTVESLIAAIKTFEKTKIKSEDCRKQAEKFSKEQFKKKIQEFVEKVMK